MPDREKVIKGIDICLQRFHCGKDCPYYNDAKIGCEEQLREDALALLKEQEAVEPITDNEGGYWCKSCYEDMVWHQKFCSNCGKPVLWEGR